MKKFLPVVLLPAVFLLGSCTTTKRSVSVDSVGVSVDSVGADSTVTAGGNATDTTIAAVAVPSIAGADTVDTTSLSGSDSSATTAPKASKPVSDSVPVDTAPKQAVSNVSIQPGQSTDEFVGAATDVTTDVCKRDGAGWTISGKVKNTSGAAANYRIYVALNRKGSTNTRALVQVDKAVANGKTESWSAKAEVTDPDLVCILRVERTATK